MSKLDIYVYQLQDSTEEMETLDSDDEVVAASHWLLPTTQFDGLWESLVYDDNVKNNVTITLLSILYCCCSVPLVHGPLFFVRHNVLLKHYTTQHDMNVNGSETWTLQKRIFGDWRHLKCGYGGV